MEPSNQSDLDLVELVQRCGAGRDADLWHELYQRLSPRLEAYVCRRLRSLQLAVRTEWVRDAVQEVYCRILERDAFAGCRAVSTAQLLAFLRVVCDNTVRDLLRAEGARKRGQGCILELDEPRWRLLEERVSDPRQDLECRLAYRETVGEARRLARMATHGRLSERNLRIFELAVLYGWSSREIRDRYARRLTIGIIDSVLFRLRRRIRRSARLASSGSDS